MPQIVQPDLPKASLSDDLPKRAVVVARMNRCAKACGKDQARIGPAVRETFCRLAFLVLPDRCQHSGRQGESPPRPGRLRLDEDQSSGVRIALQLTTHPQRGGDQVDVLPPKPEHLALA